MSFICLGIATISKDGMYLIQVYGAVDPLEHIPSSIQHQQFDLKFNNTSSQLTSSNITCRYDGVFHYPSSNGWKCNVWVHLQPGVDLEIDTTNSVMTHLDPTKSHFAIYSANCCLNDNYLIFKATMPISISDGYYSSYDFSFHTKNAMMKVEDKLSIFTPLSTFDFPMAGTYLMSIFLESSHNDFDYRVNEEYPGSENVLHEIKQVNSVATEKDYSQWITFFPKSDLPLQINVTLTYHYLSPCIPVLESYVYTYGYEARNSFSCPDKQNCEYWYST